MANKIVTLYVQGKNGIGCYNVGDLEYFTGREIAEIKPYTDATGKDWYGLYDKTGEMLCCFEKYKCTFDCEGDE